MTIVALIVGRTPMRGPRPTTSRHSGPPERRSTEVVGAIVDGRDAERQGQRTRARRRARRPWRRRGRRRRARRGSVRCAAAGGDAIGAGIGAGIGALKKRDEEKPRREVDGADASRILGGRGGRRRPVGRQGRERPGQVGQEDRKAIDSVTTTSCRRRSRSPPTRCRTRSTLGRGGRPSHRRPPPRLQPRPRRARQTLPSPRGPGRERHWRCSYSLRKELDIVVVGDRTELHEGQGAHRPAGLTVSLPS